MENTSKNNNARPLNRQPSRNTPVKQVAPSIKNQYIRDKCGSTPIRKIHNCLGQSFSRGDTWHNSVQRRNEIREEPVFHSERSSIISISTMTTMNAAKRLNVMTKCDPINGIKFLVREVKQILKAVHPDNDVLYQMISEVHLLVKRLEYADVLPIPLEENKTKRYVDVERPVDKCSECEGLSQVVKQTEEDLACEKERNKILSTRITDLESQILVKQNNLVRMEQELEQAKEQIKCLQTATNEKKLFDESLLSKFDEYTKKLQEVTEELFISKLNNEKLMTQLKTKTQVIDNLRKDIDEIWKTNNDINASTGMSSEKNFLNVERKSSTDLSYISDASSLKVLVLKNPDDGIRTSNSTINITDIESVH